MKEQPRQIMHIPQPELIKLGADWAPWKFQVCSFGDARDYGYREPRVIVTGRSNYETREAAEAARTR
jgi:hypothetical protein